MYQIPESSGKCCCRYYTSKKVLKIAKWFFHKCGDNVSQSYNPLQVTFRIENIDAVDFCFIKLCNYLQESALVSARYRVIWKRFMHISLTLEICSDRLQEIAGS